MKWTKSLTLVVLLFVAVGSVGAAQIQSYPVDIPGTDVHFFMMRYEGDTPPFAEINAIWERISEVFAQWSLEGKDPSALTPDHVTVGTCEDGRPAVMLKGNRIVSVDALHARHNRATAQQVAEKWAENLREGVAVFAERNVKK